MDKWQECTLRANTEFNLTYYGNAILLHHQALDSARCEFEKTVRVSPDRAVSKVVISHFNLADCYLALNEVARAGEYYLDAQKYLMNLLSVEQATGQLLDAIRHALSHLDFMWLNYLKKYRGDINHRYLLQYHEQTQILSNLETRHVVCH